jgi:hypothetical protein
MIFHEYVLRFVKAPRPKELAILLEDGTIAFYPPVERADSFFVSWGWIRLSGRAGGGLFCLAAF